MIRTIGRILGCTSAAAAVLAWAGSARAVDISDVKGKPLVLDITETSILSQRFDARTTEGEKRADQGFGGWLNRLNLALRWDRFTVGARLDSSVYWRRPEDRSGLSPADLATLQKDGESRFVNSLYPAKLWVTYSAPGLEVTAGDAYVQFGRGLILSIRKVDELGLDTTVRGAKIAWQSDPFSATLVAGLANPTRVDEATGRALFVTNPVASSRIGPQPAFGSDRIIGAEVQLGRGWPVVLTTHGVRFTRCAPYHYNPNQTINAGLLDTPLGSCDPADTTAWLKGLTGFGAMDSSEIDMVGQGLELPDIFGHGKVYIEGALQHRYRGDVDPQNPTGDGNALYASVSADAGALTNTLELKSYRNFLQVAGAVNTNIAPELNNVIYSAPPTAELATQDNEWNSFNICVNGGRLRSDVRLNDDILAYSALAYFRTQGENGGGCDKDGKTTSPTGPAAERVTNVWDGLSGIEWNFDGAQSHLYASTGIRNDTKDTGDPYYRELHAEYALTKHVAGPYSIELTGRHRRRWRFEENLRVLGPGIFGEQPWFEGEHYSALKIAPKWVISQGFEYTTLIGFPTYYFNGGLLYRFKSDSNVRILAGQQRGGLKCVSGVCKVFPAYEGVRVELTLRF